MRVDMHVDVGKLAFNSANVKAVSALDKAIRETAYAIEAKSKGVCPVDTGNLRGSISTTCGFMNAEVGPTAEYGHFVEYGTSRMRPQPYMGPAADAEFPQLEARVNRLLGGLL